MGGKRQEKWRENEKRASHVPRNYFVKLKKNVETKKYRDETKMSFIY